MSLELKDLAGFSEPAKKLLEMIQAAFGAAYKPRSIKSEADARAYERLAIAKADAEAERIKKFAEANTILGLAHQLDDGSGELINRAKVRLAQREIEGQKNVESIIDKSILALPSSVSPEPVNPDWRRKFFIEAENICAEDLQELWGRVLAGELARPGTFSLRTLEALKHISQDEAEGFRVLCSLAMEYGWVAIPGHDLNSALTDFGIDYNRILALRDAGLLLAGDNLAKFFKAPPDCDPGKHKVFLINNGILIELSGPILAHFSAPALIFSRAGSELQQLMSRSPNDSYLQRIGQFWRSSGITAKRGEPTSEQNGVSILSFEKDL